MGQHIRRNRKVATAEAEIKRFAHIAKASLHSHDNDEVVQRSFQGDSRVVKCHLSV